ncbi:MFS transporter [Breznakiella homolactica]|uniref:MFS transporter n=1 Tax=Breznakiella homolactica TaxID=2798577 RepID=A0A7T8BAB9_9SPIR|nr:MFS transporter [Breznakiella homolactica]QQO08840.1 MFS transporter [Breznakiella homolactica]
MKKSHIFSDLRDFLILWVSQSVSTLGTAMTNFALIVWIYGQKGTASSVTLLSVCSFLPSILFCFIAGTIADRWDKKRIMLAADLMAAVGTVTILALYLTSSLRIWHLYIINFLLSFMNAFQNPASYVATSLLVPKEHYIKVSGLQALSGSIATILAPAMGSMVLAFGGLEAVLAVDLTTFSIAFLILLFAIKIPKVRSGAENTEESFIKSCMAGIHFLRSNQALLGIILFFAFINFISKMGGYGMLPALVLSRTGNNQIALGMVEAAVGLGTLAGSILVTVIKPAKSRITVIFFSCGISFLLGDVGQSLTRSLPFWISAAFASNIPMAFLNANLTALMRTAVPIGMQGRVFSARDTIQYSTIPVGLFLGGVLADKVFEPFMAAASPLQKILSFFFGSGKGSGIAVIFFIVGALGFAASCLAFRNPLYRTLDEKYNREQKQ